MCVLRHLSKLHPLHQLLKYHCRYEELLREVAWGFGDLAGKDRTRACDWLQSPQQIKSVSEKSETP